jgi:DNA-binding NarL/FixJ family response regulator
MTISVVVADDHPVVRAGYKRLISLDPNIQVIAEFDNGEDTYSWFSKHEADLLVMDISMPGQGGLGTLGKLRLKLPNLKIIMLSMHDSPSIVQQALDNGANGFLSKSSEPEELINSIEIVMSGGTALSESIKANLTGISSKTPHEELSQREFVIFLKLAEGIPPKEIAELFNISEKTAYNYQTKIYKKLNVENGIQLVQYAKEHQLLQ